MQGKKQKSLKKFMNSIDHRGKHGKLAGK